MKFEPGATGVYKASLKADMIIEKLLKNFQ